MSGIFSIGGLVSDAMETVSELVYDESILAEIKSALLSAADSLESRGAKLPPTPHAACGGSPVSGELAKNAELARTVVMEAFAEMAVGLQGFEAVVDDFQARTGEATEASAATSRQIQSASDCVGSPTFPTATQCTLPAATGGAG